MKTTRLVILAAVILAILAISWKSKKADAKVWIATKPGELYKFKLKTLSGEEITLEKFKGKKLLLVNVAERMWFYSSTKTCRPYTKSTKIN